jgi:prepilin-type N-terminal cleavage/methylation domain-containing protein
MLDQKSFTVIELLVVIAIIGVLASIVLVSLSGTRDRAQIAKTLLYSNQIYHSLGADITGNWNFDEGSGTTALDSSGYNHTGTISGATYTTDTPQKAAGQGAGKYALSFDGTGSKNVTVANSNSLNFGADSFTIAMWGKHRDFTYPKDWFTIKKSNVCYNGAGNPGWDIGGSYSSSGLNICYNDGVNYVRQVLTSNAGYTPSSLLNQWVFLTVVFDRSASRIKEYINGVKQTNELNISTVTGSVNNSSNLVIGTAYGWQTDGILDEVQIYSAALTSAEIQKLYAEGAASHGIAME